MSFEVTIGLTAADQVNKSESFSRLCRYKDENGTAIDINAVTISVLESSPAFIATDAVITITDAAAGEFTIEWTKAQAAGLGEGRTNWFRLQFGFANGTCDTTDKIWVNRS